MSHFDKKQFHIIVSKWIKENKWKDVSTKMNSIFGYHQLEDYPYKPQYLITRKKTPFFLNFFQKGDWSQAKVLDGQGTGIDLYKYKFLLKLQAITAIQVGLVMWNESTDKFIFKQLDQLPNPIVFFKGNMCRAFQLRKTDVQFNCYKCWKEYPQICRDCIKGKKEELKKRRLREMAMWKVSEFANKIVIQPKLV